MGLACFTNCNTTNSLSFLSHFMGCRWQPSSPLPDQVCGRSDKAISRASRRTTTLTFLPTFSCTTRAMLLNPSGVEASTSPKATMRSLICSPAASDGDPADTSSTTAKAGRCPTPLARLLGPDEEDDDPGPLGTRTAPCACRSCSPASIFFINSAWSVCKQASLCRACRMGTMSRSARGKPSASSRLPLTPGMPGAVRYAVSASISDSIASRSFISCCRPSGTIILA
mmetsp:Transcript_4190/g.9557  ORF Transcript_4190/g.9557 Transcript_4190/m.9557 type:complete len:227 (+) Transcript_4190:185-865(+)